MRREKLNWRGGSWRRHRQWRQLWRHGQPKAWRRLIGAWRSVGNINENGQRK
jgi:hypothetical protein